MIHAKVGLRFCDCHTNLYVKGLLTLGDYAIEPYHKGLGFCMLALAH